MIVEILLAYAFMALLVGLRYLLDRAYYPAFQLSPFRPHDNMIWNDTMANTTYYYPSNPCTDTIVTNAINALAMNRPGFPDHVDIIPNPNISSLSNTTLESLYAYIYFTNLDSCTSPTTMPNQVNYTLRLQENDPYYYRAQQVKLNENDIFWKRSPEDFCQGNTTFANYTTQFLSIQYFVDLSIIQYVTSITPNSSSVQ
ncbi:unnamed protein product [Rotaria sp. Silwood1]|nr:unnamed protein product [Rotaria sp. Silwood1]CAF4880926.1 unnamed protein product [Rotaria sp. Silwood1]